MNFGRYQVVRELGKGAMGVVYLAHDPNIDRLVALKVLREDRISGEEFVKRFLKEARAIGRLSHPNIVTVYDVGEDAGTIYIAMEYLEGRPLNEIIHEKEFAPKEVMQLGIQVADALHYAHQKGIIHRDIKPSNIVVQTDGVVKITDFGIARIEDASATMQTQTGEILGTPAYMSPEQVLGSTVDGRSDLFSLGIILYEMSTGERPFGRQGKNLATLFNEIVNIEPPVPSKASSDVDRMFSRTIMKCLHKAADKRFSTGKDLADALRSHEKDIELATQAVMAPGKNWKKPSFLLLLPLLVVAAVAAIFFIPHKKASLDVESTPSGAEVYVNGASSGKTPKEFELPPGKYSIRMSLPGYEDWEYVAQLEEAGKYPFKVALKAIPRQEAGEEAGADAAAGKSAPQPSEPLRLPRLASLSLASKPAGAQVYIDGELKGKTPVGLELPWGEHMVRMILHGYSDFEDVVRMEEAREYPLDVQLQPKIEVAFLRVESTPPGADVYVNGASEGRAPGTFKLPLGGYSIRVSLPGYENWEKGIQLEEAREYPLKVDLKAIPGEEPKQEPGQEVKEKAGYEPVEEVMVDNAVVESVRPKIERPPAPVLSSLSLASKPVGAQVYVDGKHVGKTPLTISLPTGKHHVRARLDRYKDWEGSVQLEEDRAYPLNITLAANVKPDAQRAPKVKSAAPKAPRASSAKPRDDKAGDGWGIGEYKSRELGR